MSAPTTSKPYTRTLSDFLHGLRYEDLDTTTVATVRRLLLDYLGYASASAEEKPAEILRGLAIEAGGPGEATLLASDRRTPALWAVLVNGAMGHMTELDDTHRHTQSHPGDSILPTALAMGEVLGTDGKTFVAAVAAGYDCALRAGNAVMPTHYTRGWHPSGTLNAFGAAVTACKMMGVDAETQLHALGLASTQTAGNFAHLPNRGMSKDLNPGKGAFNGLLSAKLAAKGFTGSLDAFESPKGFLALCSDSPQPEKLVDGLGEAFLINEVAHKAYPGCYHLHSAREAAFRIAGEHGLTKDDIASVNVRMHQIGTAYVDDPEPWSGHKGLYGPRFSSQYQVALALCEGEEGLWASYDDAYTLEKLDDPVIREMMGRITVEGDAELQKRWPHGWPTEVTVRTTGGATHAKFIELPKGEPENPMTLEDIERKFGICAAHNYSDRRAAEIHETALRIDELGDVRELAGLLGAEAAPARLSA